MAGVTNSTRDGTRPVSRAIHKNGWLKKLPDKTKHFKKIEQKWYTFCIHNHSEAFLEAYDNRKDAKDHKPLSILSLAQCQHISPSIVLNLPDFAFTIVLDDKILQLAASTREQMMDWIHAMKAKLQDLGILQPKENPYAKTPIARPSSSENLEDDCPPLPPRLNDRPLSPMLLSSTFFFYHSLFEVLDQGLPPLLPPPPPPPREKCQRQLSNRESFNDVGLSLINSEDSIPPPLPPPRDATSQIKNIPPLVQQNSNDLDVQPSTSQDFSLYISQDPFSDEIDSTTIHSLRDTASPPPLVEKKKLKKYAKPLPPLPLEEVELDQDQLLIPSKEETISKLEASGEAPPPIPSKEETISKLETSGEAPPPIPPKNFSRRGSAIAESDQVQLLTIDSFGEEWDHTEIWIDGVSQGIESDTLLIANGQEHLDDIPRNASHISKTDMLQYEPIFTIQNVPDISHTFQNPNYEKSNFPGDGNPVPPIPPRRAQSFCISPSGEQSRKPNFGSPPIEEGPPPYEPPIVDAVPIWSLEEQSVVQSNLSSQNSHRNSQGVWVYDTGRPLSLKEAQTLRLKQEIAHRSGVRIQLTRRDCLDSIALVDCFGYVWIAGWKQKEIPHLHNAFHLGDKVLSVNSYKVTSAQDVIKLIKMDTTNMIEFIVRRVPQGKVFSIRRDYEGQDLGIVRESNTAKIKLVEANSLAARHGLSSKAKTMDGFGSCCWVLTEINHRPLSWFFKENEVQERLSAVGKDIPILVQPSDLVKAIKKNLKNLRNYKDFIVQ